MLVNFLATVQNNNTKTAYENDINTFSGWASNQDLIIGALKPKHIAAYRTYLSQCYSAATTNRKLAALRAYLRWLVQEEVVDAAVLVAAQSVKGLKAQQKLPRPLTAEQVRNLLCAPGTQTLSGLRDTALIALLASAGVRLSEAVDLDIGDIDLDGRCAYVYGKGSKERKVFFNAEAEQYLRSYLQTRGCPKSGPLFVNYRGERISDRYVQGQIAHYGEQLGIEGLHPHQLRHTYAVNFLDKSGEIDTVSKLLGHSQLATTQIYTRLATGRLERVYREAMDPQELNELLLIRERV